MAMNDEIRPGTDMAAWRWRVSLVSHHRIPVYWLGDSAIQLHA